jgi:DNA-binding SARP family transcriptional activator
MPSGLARVPNEVIVYHPATSRFERLPRGGAVATLAVRLLGGLGLESDGVLLRLAGPKAKSILAYLLLNRDRSHERAHLSFLLWPESHEGQARTNLRQALHQLRRSLPGLEHALELDGQQLRWHSEAPFDLDVARFERALSVSEHARDAGDEELERARLEEAVGVYRGDLLPELYDSWLGEPREALRERFANVLDRLVTLTEAQRDYLAAARYAQRAVQHDPLSESSYRRSMRIHALCGERAKALHAYHTCASLLQREFGVEPSRETRAVYAQLLRRPHEDAPHRVAPQPDVLPTAAPTVRLIGRGEEAASLRADWQRALGGRAALTLVKGDSGVGKTRLVEEFARDEARPEVMVVAARCHAAEAMLAFSTLATLMRGIATSAPRTDLDPVQRLELSRLLPELADGRPPGPLSEDWQRRRFFEALASAALMRQPLLLLVDDAPWCDRDTLEWLGFLLRFDAKARVLVLATARSHDIDTNPALLSLLEALQPEERMHALELPPLSEAECAALARSLWRGDPDPEDLAALYRETEGNPLFVVELLRGGWRTQRDAAPSVEPASTLPPKLRAVIASRLARLTPASADLLSLAAVIGRTFTSELLVHVSRQPEDIVVRCLDELWQQRIVRELRAGQYDFSHDKLREVAYEGLSLTRRRLLHRYVAEALERPAEDVASASIAYHYDLAGLPERAIPYYDRAAQDARALFAHQEAVDAFHRALTLIDGLPPSEAFASWRHDIAAHVHEGIGEVLALQGRHDAAKERFELALERLSDEHRLARARLWRLLGDSHTARYRYAEALNAFEAAEAALGRPEADADSHWHEWIEIGLARSKTHYWRRAWRDSERQLQRLEGPLTRHGTALHRALFFDRLADTDFVRCRFITSSQGLRYRRAALEAAEASEITRTIENIGFCLGFSCLWHGDLEEAQARFDEALASCERHGRGMLRARVLTYLCFVQRLRRDAAATRCYALRALEAARVLAMPEYIGAAHGHLAWLAWRRGDDEGCAREGRVALDSWQQGQRYFFQWCAHLPLLASSLRRGQLQEAMASAAALLAPTQQRLPDRVADALERAVRADAEGERAAAALRQALDRSMEARLL